MKVGDRIRPRIDESIRLHDKLLLVLSEHSIASRWVQKEVETAFEQEQQHNKLNQNELYKFINQIGKVELR